ncbi:hypothetical protein FOMPIDRAFT_1047632 [Fomitopsis schrenkii]|uniref:Uncharacterized protein n=1 Tax=Fomitopsis schrenkii TaxID=2126942 RepID=S8FXA6_FOMSC|nr:hypothetical protein FOMPIDRAFT_1047632 [Fomitopsis schrenkii]
MVARDYEKKLRSLANILDQEHIYVAAALAFANAHVPVEDAKQNGQALEDYIKQLRRAADDNDLDIYFRGIIPTLARQVREGAEVTAKTRLLTHSTVKVQDIYQRKPVEKAVPFSKQKGKRVLDLFDTVYNDLKRARTDSGGGGPNAAGR